jgi:mRNA-degrading endonuclease RelE of RelBE toxin-antitoxin system
MYGLIIPDAVARDVKHLDRSVQRGLRDEHFPRLKQDPRCGEPLRGTLKGIWSYHFKYRSTQYRIAYEILDKQMAVLLVMIGKRGDFYEALMRRVGLW